MGELIELLSFGPGGWGDELATGLWLTIRLAVATLPFGLAIGFLIALARNSGEPSLVAAGNVFTTIFRGLPELLTLFIVYYGGQMLISGMLKLFGGGYIEISGFIAGMVALGLVFAAYASEVFLGAMRGIGRGQYEAASALGLGRFSAMRLVILPQLLRLALPGLSNLWLVLLKDTSLVSVIALEDLLRKTNIAVGATKEPFFFYMTACLIYLAISLISSMGVLRAEKWASRGEARR
ncbi:MAG: ABC transporter permease [Flavobacteriaceae bacterium]